MTSLCQPDFQRQLEELRPRIGNYRWRLALLRAAARRSGRFPSKLYGLLRRLSRRNPKRPYFVGESADGILFLGDFRDCYSVAWAIMPDWDGPVVRFLMDQAAHRAGCFLDVGANLGVITASVARVLVGREEALAFEPMPETAKRAAATFALNQLTNVRLFPLALSDRDGDIPLFHAAGRSAITSAHRTELLKCHRVIQQSVIPCRSLDSLMTEGLIGRVGLIKLDVEGHELNVVRGASGLLHRDRPAIFYEQNPRAMASANWRPADMAALLAEIDEYRMTAFDTGHAPGNPPGASEELTSANVYCEFSRGVNGTLREQAA